MRDSDKKPMSRRGFITGVTVGATGAVLGREAAAQTVNLGNIDDLGPEWDWIFGGSSPDPTPPTPDPDPEPPTTDPNPTPPPQQSTVHVRRSIFSMSENGPEMASLRQGILAMQARGDTNDPISWQFQSNIHGVSGPGFNPTWDTCRHGDQFFLSWHRMYLYYFERILRASSGNPSLSLPYWDYSVSGQAALPASFRFPRDPSNPLYVPQRYGQQGRINDGAQIPSRYTNTFGAMQTMQFGSFNGTVEGTPHNDIHVQVGGVNPQTGQRGLMLDPRTAALDPIFWLHHCNVDRLWNRWIALGGGRRQPTGSILTTPYSFYDEDRNQVTLTGQEILDTAQQLDYRYDDDPSQPIGLSPEILVAAADTGAESAFLEGAAFDVAEATLAEGAGVTLGLGTAAVRLGQVEPVLPLNAGQEAAIILPDLGDLLRTDTSAAEAKPVVLELRDIEFDAPPGVSYDIYVNQPPGLVPDPSGPYFAGTFSPFAQNKASGPTKYDITGLLNRQIESGLLNIASSEIDVSFVVPAESGLSAESGLVVEPVDIGGVRIVRE